MRDKTKKFLGLILATVTLSSAFAGCGADKYKGDPVDGFVPTKQAAISNGGFAVQNGDYIYFINAQENNSESNKYGDVVKGALYRIHKDDLAAGRNNVKRIVPSLLVSQNMNAGIYIYDDYVYYATPTADKNLTGEVAYTHVDFKRAKLDGSAAPENYMVRLADNTANYRFVEAGYGATKSVYLLYEEKDDAGNVSLKSYDVEGTKKSTTLVKGTSDQKFYYDTVDATNGDVYYTMSVSLNPDSDHATSVSYNQLFKVNAAATVEVDSAKAKYTVKNGDATVKEYDFDEAYMKSKIDEAKKDKADKMPYDLKDYTTYPYVNLGTAVLDGIGSIYVDENVDERFVWDTDSACLESDGYTYTIQNYENGGLYFTRSAVATTNSPGADTSLYYLADEDIVAGDSIGMNNFNASQSKVVKVAANTNNTAGALFFVNEGVHTYIYSQGSEIFKEWYGATGTQKVRIAKGSSTDTISLLMLNGNFVYYYTGTGNQLARVDYTGAEEVYNELLAENKTYVQYQSVVIPAVVCQKGWYKPEIFGDTLLYAASQTYGTSTSLNYIHSATIGDATATTDKDKADQAFLKAKADLYEKVQEAIEEASQELKVSSAIQYFFRTGETQEYETAKATYEDKYTQKQITKIENFFARFDDADDLKGGKETDFITLIGKMKPSDDDAVKTAWVDYFAEATDEEEETGLPTWAIVLIIVGSVLVVAAGVTIPLVIVGKKKKAAKAEAEATVNAYKRKKIDTTDDKTIDVYADEEQAQDNE